MIILDYVIVVERTILFYILISIAYRFMGKREIGQLGVIDLIVSILIAELAAISIDNRHENILLGILPIVVLVVIQIGSSFVLLKNKKVRDIFDGSPSVIINKGVINFKEMVKLRYNIDDLLTQLREKQIKSIDEVEYAVLETGGKLSIFKKKEDPGDFPLPLIVDGNIENDTLKELEKSESWLVETLKKQKAKIKDVFYAFYKEKELFVIKQSEVKK